MNARAGKRDPSAAHGVRDPSDRPQPEEEEISGFALHQGSPNSIKDETLIYVARVEYSCSSVCGALELCRMASSKRIYTASNLSGATQTAATAAMVGREALTRHYL